MCCASSPIRADGPCGWWSILTRRASPTPGWRLWRRPSIDRPSPPLGAHLGHGPPDNKGHQRSVSDTPVPPFIWGNVRCQALPLGWFFPDTEEVTGSNPVAPTIILAGHGVANVEPVALATWLGRAGAARRPRRRAHMRLPGPSPLPTGSAMTTHSSRGSRPDGRPARVPCTTSRQPTPYPSAVATDGRPSRRSGLPGRSGAASPRSTTRPRSAADAPPPAYTRPPQRYPQPCLLGPSTQPPGTGRTTPNSTRPS
jgi:hypothetical protein